MKDRSKIPSFTGTNYSICSYCNNLIIGRHRDGSIDGCKLIQNKNEKYARINYLGHYISYRLKLSGIDFVDGKKGCENFEPNGVPAHPKALEILIKNNSKASLISSDPNALETSWEFYQKINNALPKENITSSRQIQ